nr:prothymosin alpha-like [Aegilops tauschii subsp. strangulata]
MGKERTVALERAKKATAKAFTDMYSMPNGEQEQDPEGEASADESSEWHSDGGEDEESDDSSDGEEVDSPPRNESAATSGTSAYKNEDEEMEDAVTSTPDDDEDVPLRPSGRRNRKTWTGKTP